MQQNLGVKVMKLTPFMLVYMPLNPSILQVPDCVLAYFKLK